MGHIDDALSLVEHAESELPKIQQVYEESLEEKKVSAGLLVEIKNLMENLRSALDFVAQELFLKYGQSSKKNPKVYFPYALESQDLPAFRKANRIEACIPGLGRARPDIVTMIEDLQHFGPSGNQWLPVFMDLNNENKHQRLTPQTRRERKEMRISGGGASIGIGEGASISIGQGASISIGGAIIRGGQTFDVNRPPVVQGGTVDVIKWVSFHFETNDEPVIPFLKNCVAGVRTIVDGLASI